MTEFHQNYVVHFMNSRGKNLHKYISRKSLSYSFMVSNLTNFEYIETYPQEMTEEEEAKETGMKDGRLAAPENIRS